MSKVLTAVFGIGIGVVVYVTMLLGIQAFYPEPEYDDFCDDRLRIAEPMFAMAECADDMTVGECRQLSREPEPDKDKIQLCQEDYDQSREVYSRNFFIIANVLGVLALIVSFFLFLNVSSMTVTNIASGIACSGIVMILWAFMRGWEGTDDKLKFVVGLIIAAIVITLAVFLNKREGKK